MGNVGGVFISHSFSDKTKFDDVCFALGRDHIAIWRPDQIAAGESLRDRLRSAIEDCPVCIFIATRKSLASDWCQAEIGAFWGAAKPVIVYIAHDELRSDELPKQFQSDKWAITIRRALR